MSLTRKQFLSSMLGIAAGASLLAACSSDSGGNADAAASGNCPANGGRVTIGSNHGHVMAVTGGEVTTGAEKPYDIRGTADHTHTVTVTAALFTMLKANTGVMTVSTGASDGHTHSITIACA